jgi:hypothetical protein
MCDWDEVLANAPDATIHSVLFGKGRDYAFRGAADGLQLTPGAVWDFEPFGVTEIAAD